MLNSDLPASEKSVNNVWQEAQNVVGAGSDTTAGVLSVTTFHLLNNPDKLEKLREELKTAAALLLNGQGWDLVTTRQLPYLVGAPCSRSTEKVASKLNVQRRVERPKSVIIRTLPLFYVPGAFLLRVEHIG